MKKMNIHLHGNQRAECRRNRNNEKSRRNEKKIFLFTQKMRNYKVVDSIIVCRDKNQIAKLYSHRFAEGNRIGMECSHPGQINECPETYMAENSFSLQKQIFAKGKSIRRWPVFFT